MGSLKWSINQKSLTFYFDKFEIAAGVAGAIKVDIPMEDVASILTKESANMLHIVKKVEEVEELTHKIKTGEHKTTNLTVDYKSDINSIDENVDSNGKYVALTFDDGVIR